MPDFEFNDLQGKPQPALEDAALKNLQCNILRSTGRARSTQVFRRFTDKESFKQWLSETTVRPSAATDTASDVLVNVLFTAAGLKLLGVDEGTIARMDPAFVRGSRDSNTLDKLGDGVTSGWGPHRAPWHVVELHAYNGDKELDVELSSDCVIEHGGGIRKDGSHINVEGEHSYGHLGILDGLSKVVYTQEDYDKLVDANGGPPTNWDPRHPLSTLLVKDVFTPETFGSYFVFRKLDQDVTRFQHRLEEIAREIEKRRSENRDGKGGVLAPEHLGFAGFGGKSNGELIEQVKLWIFGRDTDGNTAFGGKDNNDFNFEQDRDGTKCPFHAHVRKMNPRRSTNPRSESETLDLTDERKRVLARRGTSGHTTTIVSKGKPETTPHTALLFWCAQANIGEQFEYVQEKWANGSNVDLNHAPTPDVDSVIGRLHPRLTQPAEGASHWERWKTTSHQPFDVWDAIHLIASEYLYAPSIPGFDALKNL